MCPRGLGPTIEGSKGRRAKGLAGIKASLDSMNLHPNAPKYPQQNSQPGNPSKPPNYNPQTPSRNAKKTDGGGCLEASYLHCRGGGSFQHLATRIIPGTLGSGRDFGLRVSTLS